MPLPLPALVEYLAVQRRTPAGRGRIAMPQFTQYQVPYIAPATATTRSIFSIATGPNVNDVAALGWHISADKRVPPDVLRVNIVEGGVALSTLTLTSDHIQDGLSSFLFIGQDDFLRWDVENLSLLPSWFVGTLMTLAVSTLDDLEQVRAHIYAYARGPYYKPREAQYGQVDYDQLAAKIDLALERWSTSLPGGGR